jgi:hypothetical protein
MGRRRRSAWLPGLTRRARFGRGVPVARRRARAGRPFPRGPFARREGVARAHPLTWRPGLLGRATGRRPAGPGARPRLVPGPWSSRGTIELRRTVGSRSGGGSGSGVRSRTGVGPGRGVRPWSTVGPLGTSRSRRARRPHVSRNVDQATRRIHGGRVQHLLPARAHAAAARGLTGAGTHRIGPGLLAAPRVGYLGPVPVSSGPAPRRTGRHPDPDNDENQQGNQANRNAHPA